jgi:hypothetical protein
MQEMKTLKMVDWEKIKSGASDDGDGSDVDVEMKAMRWW